MSGNPSMITKSLPELEIQVQNTVNHSINFVNPDYNEAHTNTIEGI